MRRRVTSVRLVVVCGVCWSDSAGDYCPDADHIVLCVEGSFMPILSSYFQGTFSTGGAVSCTDCARGTYQPVDLWCLRTSLSNRNWASPPAPNAALDTTVRTPH